MKTPWGAYDQQKGPKGERGMSRTQAQYMRRMKKRARRKRAWGLVLLGAVLVFTAWGYQVWQQKHEEAAQRTARSCQMPGQTWYALRLGSFETEGAARERAVQFLGRGAGGVIKRAEGAFHLLAAAYENRADAVRVQENLMRFYNVESDVYSLSWDGAQMTLSGTEKQTGAMQKCYDFMNALGKTVSHLILQLDEGALSRAEAEGTVTSCMESAQLLEKELLSVFGREENVLSNDMGAALFRVRSAFEQALREQGDVRFGAYVKRAHLEWALAMQGHRMLLQGLISSP